MLWGHLLPCSFVCRTWLMPRAPTSLFGTLYQLVRLHCTPCTHLRRRSTHNTHRTHCVRHTHTRRVVVKPEMPHLCIDATNNTYTTHAATPRQTRKLSWLIYFRNFCLSSTILVLCLPASCCLCWQRHKSPRAGQRGRHLGGGMIGK